ncbi:uncharacterized protein LOC132255369 [Phlebotomus argentipes]|uniref:uncharacterized protein LOC132255369 n=1 Tax=Phlebotomus argentipes TaxID=94469 RepID=UPI002892F4C3|nr:uncharacterized protein LOC132255369 [Phlebotomus argentipes]
MEDSAFELDCKNLISDFVTEENYSFNGFCEQWTKHQFYYIFHGFSRTFELIEFTDIAIPVVKRLFAKAAHFREQLGAFYLLYSLYLKQPAKEFTKIRIRQSDWEILKAFVDKASLSEEFIQARLAFWKLVQINAFLFVATDEEYGFDRYLNQQEVDSDNDEQPSHPENGVKKDLMNFVGERSGILTALQLVELGYNEMKEGLKDPRNDKLLPQSNCAAEILSGLRRINEIFNPDTTLEAISGDSRKKALKKRALKGKGASAVAPEESPQKKIRTTMWKKMVQMNDDFLQITMPLPSATKRFQSFTNRLFYQNSDNADCDVESEDEEEFSETEEKILPDIN